MEAFVFQTKTVSDPDTAPYIRMYGINDQNQLIAVNVHGFHAHVYISVTREINIDDFRTTIRDTYGYNFQACELVMRYPSHNPQFKRLPPSESNAPGEYDTFIDKHGDKTYKTEKIPYIYLSFKSHETRKSFVSRFMHKPSGKPKFVPKYDQFEHRDKEVYIKLNDGPGGTKRDFHLRVHHQFAEAVKQFVTEYSEIWIGWIRFTGPRIVPQNRRGTDTSRVHTEYSISNLSCISVADQRAPPRIPYAALDIEVHSDNHNVFPTGDKPAQVITCIGLVAGIEGERVTSKHAISLGTPTPTKVFDSTDHPVISITGNEKVKEVHRRADENPAPNSPWPARAVDVPEGTVVQEVISCTNENKLLEATVKKLIEINPIIIDGYNTLGFDFPYIIKRGRNILKTLGELDMNVHNQLLQYRDVALAKRIVKRDKNGDKIDSPKILELEGILIRDLYPFVLSLGIKLNSYSLNSVAQKYLPVGEEKLSPTYKGGFLAYDMTLANSPYASGAMGLWNKYCVQDCNLLPQVSTALKSFMVISTSANLMNVDFETAYTSGKLAHVYAQLYKFCIKSEMVLEYDARLIDPNAGKFGGAFVLEPKKGMERGTMGDDYASLYPSLIISNGLCSTREIPWDSDIPWEDTLNEEWWDHVGCEHDEQKRKVKASEIRCRLNRHRFVKHVDRPALVPTVTRDALVGRAIAKGKMGAAGAKRDAATDVVEKAKYSFEFDLYNSQQCALKVNANSIYGVTGTKVGSLQMRSVAACTTYSGRETLMMTKGIIETLTLGKIVDHFNRWPCAKLPMDFYARLAEAPHDTIVKYILYGDTDSLKSKLAVGPLKLYTDHVYAIVRHEYVNDGYRMKKVRVKRSPIPEGKQMIIEGKMYVVKAVGIKWVPIFDVERGYYVLVDDAKNEALYDISKERCEMFAVLCETWINSIGIYKDPMRLAYEEDYGISSAVIHFRKKKYHFIPLLTDSEARKRAEDILKRRKIKFGTPYTQEEVDDLCDDLGNEGDLYVKGTELARRTGCPVVKDLLRDVNELVMHYASRDRIREQVLHYIKCLLTRQIRDEINGTDNIEEIDKMIAEGKRLHVTLSRFEMSKQLAGEYRCNSRTKCSDEATCMHIPAHAILARKMNNRGKLVVAYERLPYQYGYPDIFEYDKASVHTYDYIESSEYMREFNLPLAYLAYIRDMIVPIGDLLDVRHVDRVLVLDKFKVLKPKRCAYNSNDTSKPICKREGPLCAYHSTQSYKREYTKRQLFVRNLDQDDKDTKEMEVNVTSIRDLYLAGTCLIQTDVSYVSYLRVLYLVCKRYKRCLYDLKYNVRGPILVEVGESVSLEAYQVLARLKCNRLIRSQDE